MELGVDDGSRTFKVNGQRVMHYLSHMDEGRLVLEIELGDHNWYLEGALVRSTKLNMTLWFLFVLLRLCLKSRVHRFRKVSALRYSVGIHPPGALCG